MENKLDLLTECEKAALPLALFAMYLDPTGKKDEKSATTKETNITFTFKELQELYGK
jgi:hypothetical protein